MRKLLLILLFLPFLIFSQTDKRLALVIGNSDYEFTTKLKNPVNDALLIAKTLEELEFDVVLGTNLKDENAFFDKIEEFAEKRSDYDVAIVFYAGHGSQIENQNYLLPTGLNAKTERDVKYKAVSVQMILDVLTDENKVNILILDACRDNTFEKDWSGKTRSSSTKGSGLARMQAPSGSLIAFSTTAGTTAPDGEGVNSDYSRVLAEQMKVPGISIYEVFSNVRKEIKALSGGYQQTEESTQLTGKTLYLVKNNYSIMYDEVWNLFFKKDYDNALEKIGALVALDDINARAYKLRGDIYTAKKKYKEAEDNYTTAIRIDSTSHVVFYNRGIMYANMQNYDRAIEDYNRTIEIDSTFLVAFNNRALCYKEQGKYDLALEDLNKAIKSNPNNKLYYSNRADIYKILKYYDKAENDYTTAIGLDLDNVYHYNNRASLYSDVEKIDLALKDYETVLNLDSTNTRALNNRAIIFQYQGDYLKAIEEYTKAINLEGEALYYRNRAECHFAVENWDQAKEDYDQAIMLEKKDPLSYQYRAAFYLEQREFSNSLEDLNKALKLDPNNWEIHFDIANVFMVQEKWSQVSLHITNAIKFTEDSLVLGTLYGSRATAYQIENLVDKAEKDIEQSLKYAPDNQLAPISLLILYLFNGKNHKADSLCNAQILIEREVSFNSFFYAFKGLIAYRLDKHDNALSHLSKSLKINDAMSEDAWIMAYSIISKMYITSKKYKEAKDICKKAIEENKDNINAHYDLALIYSLEEDPYESIESLNEVIELIESGISPPAKEDWLINNYVDVAGVTALSDIHQKRGEQWNKLGKKERACKDYQSACDLGDCEMFNINCK